MVWFYLFDFFVELFLTFCFQSHYGLILSNCLAKLSVLPTLHRLSIPLWSDFIGGRTRRRPVRIGKLSIPLWSDFIFSIYCLPFQTYVAFNPTMVWFYRIRFLRLLLSLCHLSIPLWSDFIFNKHCNDLLPVKNFQSHYGLILSYTVMLRKKRRWGDGTFQSHYGLILSL